MRFWRIFLRSCRLVCPACGHGPQFIGWFRMHETCSHCGLKFKREPGFFLGSIYFNYGLTALLVMVAYLALFFTTNISPEVLLWSLTAFCLLFPLWFFRYARSLWLGMDEYFDPRGGDRTPASDGSSNHETTPSPSFNRSPAASARSAKAPGESERSPLASG
jgi:uncharacterized protein (DUF983 family)